MQLRPPRVVDYCAFAGLPKENVKKVLRQRAGRDIYWSYQPTKVRSIKVYGQPISRNAAIQSVEKVGNEDGWGPNMEVMGLLWDESRDSEGEGKTAEGAHFSLSSGLAMPIKPTLRFKPWGRKWHFVLLQPTKGFPFTDIGYRILRRIADHCYKGTEYSGLDWQVLDFGAPDGKNREAKCAWLSEIDPATDAEFSRVRQVYLEAHAEVAREDIEPPPRRPSKKDRPQPPQLPFG